VTFVFLYIRTDYFGRRFSQDSDQRALAPMTHRLGDVFCRECGRSRPATGLRRLPPAKQPGGELKSGLLKSPAL
jgi:hypothetical protein